MLRAIAASYWTALALGVVVFVLHVGWYVIDRPTGGEVVSGFGAALVVLGVLVAARPFLRTGVRGMAEQAVQGSAPSVQGYDGPPPEAYVAHEARILAAMPDIWAERVSAVLVIVLGTLLNGYGPLIARLCRLRTG